MKRVVSMFGTMFLLAVVLQVASFTAARADVPGPHLSTLTTFSGRGGYSAHGVGLLVIYSNPSLPSKTISVVDGGANPFGDSATFSFPSFPLGGSAQMSLGIGFSYQGGQPTDPGTHTCGTDSVQSSEVDINVAGNRLTSCAGNYDDGFGQNGALITVGGVGDSTDNPSDPFQQPGDGGLPRVDDDELYDLSGY